MPLPRVPRQDILIWRYDSSGTYSVKSGYNLLACEFAVHDQDLDSSELQRFKSFYANLWSLSVPSKIKVMFWRLSKNYLPTNVNLSNRRLSVNPSCHLCVDAPETIYHIIECAFTKRICSNMGINYLTTSSEKNWVLWLATLFDPLNVHQRLFLVVSIRAIWSYRNNKLHNNTLQSEAELIRFIRVYIAELTSHGVSHAPSVAKTAVKWTPPPGNTIKFNFDASFDSLLQSSVSGVVAQNSDGLLMAAGTTPHRYVANPEMAEAFACEDALILAVDLGFNRIIIEGDALTVVNKVMAGTEERSLSRGIFQNISAMKASFVDLKFAHVNRSGNSPAHLLAKEGKNFSAPMVWIEKVVPTVEVAIQNDRWWVQRSD
ncbi:hypothetical protein GQ457_01G010840 [Hibiscus cannabinus]